MRTRHDIPIAWRLGAGFASIFAVMLVLGTYVYVSQARSERAQQEFTTRHVPLSDAAGRLERALLYVDIGLRSYMLSPEPATRQAATASVDVANDAMHRLDLLAHEKDVRADFDPLVPAVEGYLALAGGLAHGTEGEDVVAVEKQLGQARARALDAVRGFDELQDRKRDAALHAMERARDEVVRAGLAAFVLVLAILLFVGFYTVRSIRRPAVELVRIANALRSGDWKPAMDWSPEAVAARGDRPRPRSELGRIAHAFGAAAVALDRREARLRADARVAAATASSLQLESLARVALDAMLEASQARSGVFFSAEGEALRAIALHQVSAADASAFERQGVPRRAARECRLVVLQPAPVDTALHLSGGHGVPAAIAAVPLVFGDEALGVVALAAAQSFDDETRDFLEAAAAQVAVGLANVRAHEKAQRLLEQIQAQNEEIQAQSEQLQAQNEELQSQADQIIESNDLLRRQAQELTHADERKNQFLGLLAHELRNPLAAISNSAFMLGHPSAQPHQVAQARTVIERQMKHLTRMIDDLLDVTRISRGKLRLQRESLDLAQLVRECLEDHRHGIEHAGLQLTVDVPDEPVPVHGDRTRLGQVLSNLVHNAVKFNERGGRIEVRLAREGDRAALHVVDTGIGMDAGLLRELFEPFSQGESAHTRPNAGLGLGLALARSLVRMHGGQVVAHSDGPSMGAEFVVTLPVEGSGQPAVDAGTFLDAARKPDGIVSEDLGRNE